MAGFYVFDTSKKSSLTRTVTVASISFASVCLMGFLYTFLIALSNTSILYMIFLLPLVINTWQHGIRGGIFSLIFGSGAVFYLAFYYLQTTVVQPLTLFPFILFIIEGSIITYIVDITRKTDLVAHYEKKLLSSEREVKHTKEQLAKTHHEIKARDEFLSIASHELKTPITSMLLQLQTALHNIRNVSLANFSVVSLLKMLESAESQSMRVSKLINDLLNVSLITTGRLDLEREDMDLTQTIQEVIDRFSEKAKKEGYEIHVEADDKVIGYWDKLRIEQVLSNLITNAIKYGDKKPITIRTSQSNSHATIMVIDQGIGIAQDKVNTIFRKFSRAVETQAYKGLGVGLYITHQIVKAHGGMIKVSSKLGKGTIFIVELPTGVEKHLSHPRRHLPS